ncbi:hypothetical protein CMUS01_07008 [Colletotrichum musicola]|uniref:Uncharacterized protein n=1 Tax=Colletotrichum musicola TaxID=2175873 RepID=A0A8H6NGZ4_9PEZI|nr:hypothetical protein CMUS01_07008 [Colletotrichum musicola]
MEAQDPSNLTCRLGDGQISFNNGQQPFSFTWSPPTDSVEDNVVEGNDRKRRRVQVDVVKQGIAVLKLGSEMTFDFKSTHADIEKKLADVTAERENLKAEIETLQTELVQRNEAFQRQEDELDQRCGDFQALKDDMLAEFTARRNELEKNLKKTATKLKKSQANLEHSQEKLKDSQAQLESVEERIEGCFAMLADRDKHIDDVQHEKSIAKMDQERALGQLKTAEQSIHELKRQIKTDKAAAAAAQDAATKQIQELQEAKKKVQDEMIELQASKEEQCRRLQCMLRSAEGDKWTEVDEHVREKNAVLAECEELRLELQDSQTEQARLSDSLQRLQSAAADCQDCERLEQELKDALELQDKTNTALHKLQEKYDRLMVYDDDHF